MLDRLDRDERLRLVRFVCVFAWADHELRPEERELVTRFARSLAFDEEAMGLVRRWLAAPPDPKALEASAIPAHHRVIFVEAIEAMVLADGEISESERSLVRRVLALG